MKKVVRLSTMVILLAMLISACNHQPKVVSPVVVPENIDSLKTYADRATQTNDPMDQYMAANYYLEQYSSTDTVKAIELLIKSAKENNPFAANLLGNIYSADSTDARYDINKAIEYYEIGVKNGSVRAMTNLANMYMNGEGVPVDYKKALQLRTDATLGLLALAENGDAAAQLRLGCNLFYGTGLPNNVNQGVKWLMKSAAQGYVPAFKHVGFAYSGGYGELEQDLKEAFNYYKKGADNNDSFALYKVAECYSSGRGVENDLEKAFEYYLKAAELGNTDAMFSTAIYYQNGDGTKTDYKEAFKWYKKCAERGNLSAMNNIGAMYSEGQGVAEDKKEAFKWFMKAAEKGSSFSQRVVGDCYRNGLGVEVDKTQAFEWYKKAADQGEKLAMNRLARCYLNGEGVPKDIELAEYWSRQSN